MKRQWPTRSQSSPSSKGDAGRPQAGMPAPPGASEQIALRRAWAAAVWALVLLVLVAAIAVGQVVKRGNIATIQAEQLEYDWETGDTKMTGNCRVDIKGDYDATMTTPALVFKTDIEKAQVLSFEASGPVTFDVLTRPTDGKRSRIQARCSDSATFSEETMLAIMKGNAHAEITGVPRVENVKSAVYDGDSMTIDLKNHTIKLSQAHLKVEMAPETGGAAEGTE